MTNLHPYTVVRAAEPGTSPIAAFGDKSMKQAEMSTLGSLQHSISSVSPDRFATCSVPLRMIDLHGRIGTVQTLVTYVGNSTFEIRVKGSQIGFIHCTDRAFAARVAPRVGQATVCPQCLIWDEAARELLLAAGFSIDLPEGVTVEPRPPGLDRA